LKNLKSETLYGISVDGKKTCIWDEEMPDPEKTNLKLELLYESYEIVEKNISYKLLKKLL